MSKRRNIGVTTKHLWKHLVKYTEIRDPIHGKGFLRNYLQNLSDFGYVKVEKSKLGNRTRLIYYITDKGISYLKTLESRFKER